MQDLIDRKGILDGDGNPYHFKAHALRHTRALEYTEQGMPIGIIQQVLGHCSLQMTLHYAKVSENMLYKKWKETEKLNRLHLECTPPNSHKEKNVFCIPLCIGWYHQSGSCKSVSSLCI